MTQTMIDNLIGYYVDIGWCDKAEALLNSIQSGGANRATNVNKQRQEQRERRHRELIQHVRPAADKYQQELAGKAAEHSDTLAARQAFAVVLRTRNRSSAAAYHLKAVLDARQKLLPAEDPDIQICRLELGTIRLQQKKYADAEPLLLEAYAALKQTEEKSRSTQTLLNLVKLYEAWDKKDKAEEWRKKL
jgi:thioredoxin-like negative regulator of GroEL